MYEAKYVAGSGGAGICIPCPPHCICMSCRRWLKMVRTVSFGRAEGIAWGILRILTVFLRLLYSKLKLHFVALGEWRRLIISWRHYKRIIDMVSTGLCLEDSCEVSLCRVVMSSWKDAPKWVAKKLVCFGMYVAQQSLSRVLAGPILCRSRHRAVVWVEGLVAKIQRIMYWGLDGAHALGEVISRCRHLGLKEPSSFVATFFWSFV